ncbi:hypothetical protein ACJX0J_025804, partial [Zea mays]
FKNKYLEMEVKVWISLFFLISLCLGDFTSKINWNFFVCLWVYIADDILIFCDSRIARNVGVPFCLGPVSGVEFGPYVNGQQHPNIQSYFFCGL